VKIGLTEIVIILIIGAGIFLFPVLTRKPPPANPTPVLRRHPAIDTKAEKNKRRQNTALKIGGIVLILSGSIMLLSSFKLFDFLKQTYTWGAIIIIIGLMSLFVTLRK
jgi:hypothetical protein